VGTNSKPLSAFATTTTFTFYQPPPRKNHRSLQTIYQPRKPRKQPKHSTNRLLSQLMCRIVKPSIDTMNPVPVTQRTVLSNQHTRKNKRNLSSILPNHSTPETLVIGYYWPRLQTGSPPKRHCHEDSFSEWTSSFDWYLEPCRQPTRSAITGRPLKKENASRLVPQRKVRVSRKS